MDAIKFINEKVRMCDIFSSVVHTCTGCPLAAFDGCDFDDLVDQDRVEEAVELVEKWAKENPRKTRQSLFLEQYPDAQLDDTDVLCICPAIISSSYRKDGGRCINSQKKCSNCRYEFWSQEVK